MTAAPLVSQIAASPVSFCHSRSGLPSLLKSPAALTCQSGPGIAEAAAAGDSGAVAAQTNASPLSFCKRDAVCGRSATADRHWPPYNGLLSPCRCQLRAGIAETAAAERRSSAVQFPDRDLAARCSGTGCREAVAIEVAGADRVPARPRIAEAGAGDDRVAVHLPDRRLRRCRSATGCRTCRRR